jgi:DNA-binding NarL/FixJ family response regulator
VRVLVAAPDRITADGVAAVLSRTPCVTIITGGNAGAADVRLVVADAAPPTEIRVRAPIGVATPPTVLIVDLAPLSHLAHVADRFSAAAVVPRDVVTRESLVEAITAAIARRDQATPRILSVLHEMALRYENAGGRETGGPWLDDRERDVLRLVADGYDTEQIAAELNYSSRTIKNVVGQVLERAQLRNRTQAVAWAIRGGLL